jgi:hypothetical protein
MKRLCTLLSLIFVFVLLVVPTVARADDLPAATPDGWTWDETAAPADPAATSDPAPADSGGTTDGWTWDETAAPADSTATSEPAPAGSGGTTDGWTWDEV